jgi:hypothetical protein
MGRYRGPAELLDEHGATIGRVTAHLESRDEGGFVVWDGDLKAVVNGQVPFYDLRSLPTKVRIDGTGDTIVISAALGANVAEVKGSGDPRFLRAGRPGVTSRPRSPSPPR